MYADELRRGIKPLQIELLTVGTEAVALEVNDVFHAIEEIGHAIRFERYCEFMFNAGTNSCESRSVLGIALFTPALRRLHVEGTIYS